MNLEGSLPRALAEALKHVYGCTLCGWQGALVDCLDAAEHGVLCPHCFALAGRSLDGKGRIDVAGPRYRQTCLSLQSRRQGAGPRAAWACRIEGGTAPSIGLILLRGDVRRSTQRRRASR